MHYFEPVSWVGVHTRSIHSPEIGRNYALPVETWDRIYGQWSIFPDSGRSGDVQCQWLEHYYTANSDEGGMGYVQSHDFNCCTVGPPVHRMELDVERLTNKPD